MGVAYLLMLGTQLKWNHLLKRGNFYETGNHKQNPQIHR